MKLSSCHSLPYHRRLSPSGGKRMMSPAVNEAPRMISVGRLSVTRLAATSTQRTTCLLRGPDHRSRSPTMPSVPVPATRKASATTALPTPTRITDSADPRPGSEIWKKLS